MDWLSEIQIMNKMKEMPVSEMPYEKCANKGAHFLSDAELLAVIIRSGSKDKNSLETANELLQLHPTYKGLMGLHYLTQKDMMKIKGIGKITAIQIACALELSKRLWRTSKDDKVKITTPDDVATFFMQEMRVLEKEHLYAVYMDASGRLLHWDVIFVGTIQYALANPREILRLALLYDAAQYIILHNHPSGDPRPSPEDIKITENLQKASALVNLPLVDHIIIGDNQYVSFKEQGLMK